MSEKLEDLEQSESDLATVWKIRGLLHARGNKISSEKLAKEWGISQRHARRHLQEADAYFEVLLPLIIMQPEMKFASPHLEDHEEPPEEVTYKISLKVITDAFNAMYKDFGRLLEKYKKSDGRT